MEKTQTPEGPQSYYEISDRRIIMELRKLIRAERNQVRKAASKVNEISKRSRETTRENLAAAALPLEYSDDLNYVARMARPAKGLSSDVSDKIIKKARKIMIDIEARSRIRAKSLRGYTIRENHAGSGGAFISEHIGALESIPNSRIPTMKSNGSQSDPWRIINLRQASSVEFQDHIETCMDASDQYAEQNLYSGKMRIPAKIGLPNALKDIGIKSVFYRRRIMPIIDCAYDPVPRIEAEDYKCFNIVALRLDRGPGTNDFFEKVMRLVVVRYGLDAPEIQDASSTRHVSPIISPGIYGVGVNFLKAFEACKKATADLIIDQMI
jgi:hypothetical protein